MSITLFIFSLFLEILYDVLFSTMFALSTNVGLFSHMLGTYYLVYRRMTEILDPPSTGIPKSLDVPIKNM